MGQVSACPWASSAVHSGSAPQHGYSWRSQCTCEHGHTTVRICGTDRTKLHILMSDQTQLCRCCQCLIHGNILQSLMLVDHRVDKKNYLQKVQMLSKLIMALLTFTRFLWLPEVISDSVTCFHFLACKGTERAPVLLQRSLSITCDSGLQIHVYSGPLGETPYLF